MTVFSTHHTYPDITQGGRLVRVSWDTSTIERAIMATLRTSPEAVILQVTIDGKLAAQGLMPAGLG